MKTSETPICVICHNPIERERDGQLCDGCRNPVHYECVSPNAATAGRGCCAVCGVNLAAAAVRRSRGQTRPIIAAEQAAADIYTDYSQVPWHRRSDVNNLFVLLGLFGCLPLTFWTCLNLLTGDVYFSYLDNDGVLARWGIINRIWAFVFATGWTFIFIGAIVGAITGRAQ